MIEPTKLVEHMLVELKTRGASTVEAVKAIHLEHGLSHCEAERAFSSSPVWVKEAVAGNRLHGEIIAALNQDELP